VGRFRRTGRSPGRAGLPSGQRATFAALDLGTNNCRLLVAEPAEGGFAGAGFRVLDGFSQIVRLGEGLNASGRLSEAAMDRAMGALAACVEKIERHQPLDVGCIATQACRAAENGAAFLARVEDELGLRFDVIDPADEARLAVLGCAALLDPEAEAALVVDIGGGSTELCWVEPAQLASHGLYPPLAAWCSSPVGVVTLAEAHPEPLENGTWYEELRARLRATLGTIETPPRLREAFEAGRAHIIGTSGAITSLAGVHLGLPRYQRSKVDGIWISDGDMRAAAERLRSMSPLERARHPCIGPDRADLVVPGCAILEAVTDLWPTARLRVADRGLREGVLMTLIANHRERAA
jgi:exopolyphosphatase/guanosine-5'-triphosphate,3'-diphosphate pyrophosphatase